MMSSNKVGRRYVRTTTVQAAAGGIPWAIVGAGILGLLLLIVAATAVRADTIESKVAARTNEGLADENLAVEVDVNGRDVVLRGTVASEEERQSAVAIADEAWGSRVVREELELVPTATADSNPVTAPAPVPVPVRTAPAAVAPAAVTPAAPKPDPAAIEREIAELIALRGIQFRTGQATLTPEGQRTLDEVRRTLAKAPALELEIAGHTDSQGRPDRNRALSQARAQTVKGYLVKTGGYDADRFVARGYGQSKPIATNATPAGRQKNRRIEFHIINRKAR